MTLPSGPAGDKPEPQQNTNDSAADDAISPEELNALLNGGASATPAPTSPPAAQSAASQVFDDSISAEELDALVQSSGIVMPGPVVSRMPPPVPVAPPPAPKPPPAAPTPAPPTAAAPVARPGGFSPLSPETATALMSGLSLLYDVPLRVSVELGRIHMTLQQVLALGRGSLIELERLAGEPVDILVNDTLIGRGEVVVVDENFGVKITELVETKG